MFDLQESDITTTTERMDILASLPQPKRPALLIIVEELTCHIRVLWGIEKLPYSYANKTTPDGRVLAFSGDIISVNTPPTIAVDKEWWDKDKLPYQQRQWQTTRFPSYNLETQAYLRHHQEQQRPAFHAHASRL